MFSLYNVGNKSVKTISTPESRVPDTKEFVQGLTLLPIPLSATRIKKLITLGHKRLSKMDKIYLRRIVMERSNKNRVVRIAFLNTDAEREFVKINRHKKDFKKRKNKFMEEYGLANLTVDDLVNPSKNLQKEIDTIPDRFNRILAKKDPINKNALYMGLPYYRVTVNAPLTIAGNTLLLSKELTTEDTSSIYTLL